jgi:hypothetical protein
VSTPVRRGPSSEAVEQLSYGRGIPLCGGSVIFGQLKLLQHPHEAAWLLPQDFRKLGRRCFLQ